MTEFAVGCGQLTWNQFAAHDAAAWPEERVLAEIAEAGYDGAPAGPGAGRSARQTVELYARHGLRPAPGYLAGAFWQADQRATILEQAKREAAFAREVGCRQVYVAASGSDYLTRAGRTRSQAAGHVFPEDALTDDEYRRFAEVLSEVGAITLREDVQSCFHNHVGTPIETRQEVDRLLAAVDPATVFLGPDTGHLAWAGADPVAFCRDQAARIPTIHLKDIDAEVAQRGRDEDWDYGAFSRHGVFTELGQGCVDFAAIVDLLRERGFSGWMIVETDVTQRPTALESARVSRECLRGLGV